MHAEKNKGADQSGCAIEQLICAFVLLLIKPQVSQFISRCDLYNASYIKVCKNNNAFADDFQCLRSNCGSVVF